MEIKSYSTKFLSALPKIRTVKITAGMKVKIWGRIVPTTSTMKMQTMTINAAIVGLRYFEISRNIMDKAMPIASVPKSTTRFQPHKLYAAA